MKKLMIWECVGAVLIIIAGTLLHSAYHNYGYWMLAWFSPVNESVWEHLKIGIWPALFFAIIEYPFIKSYAKNIIIAKTVQVYIFSFATLAIFYSYTAYVGTNILPMDIITFILAVIIGQVVSYVILSAVELDEVWDHLASTALYIMVGVILFVTYFPPHYPIFMDTTNGQYGLVIKRGFIENASIYSKNTLLAILILVGAFFVMNFTAPFRMWSMNRKMDKIIDLLEKIAKK
jgi:Family of unknown function (DUF6512)